MTSVFRRAPAPAPAPGTNQRIQPVPQSQQRPEQPVAPNKPFNQPVNQSINQPIHSVQQPVQQASMRQPVNQSRYVKQAVPAPQPQYHNDQLMDQYDEGDQYDDHVNQPHQSNHPAEAYYDDQQYDDQYDQHGQPYDQSNDQLNDQYYEDQEQNQYDDHEAHQSHDQYGDEISDQLDELAIDQNHYGDDDQYDQPTNRSMNELQRVDESEFEPEDSQHRPFTQSSTHSTPSITNSLPFPTLGSTFPPSINQSINQPASSKSFESPMPTAHDIPAAKQVFNQVIDLWQARLKQARHDSSSLDNSIQLLQSLRTQYLSFQSANQYSDDSSLEQTCNQAMIDALCTRLNSHRLNPLLFHALSQVIDHLSVALAGIGYHSFGRSSIHVCVSARDSRSLALKAALRAKPMTAPQIYLPGRLAGDIDSLSFELRLPVSQFHVLPTVARKGSNSSTAAGSIHTIDAKHFQTLIARHQRERKSPAILILSLGTSGENAPFQADDLDELLPIAQHYKLWMHAEGTQVIECGEPSPLPEDSEQNNGLFADQLDSYISLNKEVKNASFVTSNVDSVTFDANQFITLPSTLGVCLFTGLTDLAPEILPHTHSALSSINAQTLLTAWWVLTGQSSRSFHDLVDMFPLSYHETTMRLNTALDTIESSGLNVTLAPVHSEQVARAPHVLVSFSLDPPFNAQFFHFSQVHVQELISDLLARECEFDETLGRCYANSSFIPSVNAHDHNAFSFNFSARLPLEAATNDFHIDMFNHFMSTVNHCMDIVSSVGKVRDEMVHLIESESDLQFVDASLLDAHSRPGFVAFRFTPASIPASFHNDLTHALSIALTTISPEFYRAAGTYDGDECIVLDICSWVYEVGPRAIVDAIMKQTKRLRLPANVEAHLAEELKARIMETESQLKTSSQPGGLRSVPIVGSLFSLFGSAVKPKGHSYDIKSGSFADSKPAQPSQPVQQTLPKEVPFSRGVSEAQNVEPHSQFRDNHPNDHSHDAEEEQFLDDESEQARQYEEQQQMQYDEAEFVDPEQPDEQPAQEGDFEHEYESEMQHQYDEQVHHQHEHHPQAQQSAQQPMQHIHRSRDQHGEITVQMHPYRDEDPHQAQPAPEDRDALFSTLSSRDPNELMNFIADGDVLTIFFPNPNAPGLHAIQLYLFYSAEDHALCWCEPGQRYSVPDQTLPISKISELHLGATMESFPHDADSSKCFSIISDLITLHCEAEDTYRRNEMLLALYHMLSNTEADVTPQPTPPMKHQSPPVQHQQPPPQTRAVPPQQQQQQQPQPQQQQQPRPPRQPVQPAARQSAPVQTAQPTQPTARRSPQQPPAPTPLQTQLLSKRTGNHPVAGPPPHTPSHAPHPQVPTDVSNALRQALAVLETGTPFTVFLIDRSQPGLTTRHSVVLWWRSADNTGNKGRLCWARRAKHGESQLEYHPSRSLLLSGEVELLLGKQGKTFKNPGLDDVETDRCVTITVDRTNLNLAATSKQQRDRWLDALRIVMSHQGSRMVTA